MANHGWLLNAGVFLQLDYPNSTFTQALGLNNRGQVVGAYMDSAGLTHGFVYTVSSGQYASVDDPNGVGSTIVNGVNDAGVLVGFYGAPPINSGFVAIRSNRFGKLAQPLNLNGDRVLPRSPYFCGELMPSRDADYHPCLRHL